MSSPPPLALPAWTVFLQACDGDGSGGDSGHGARTKPAPAKGRARGRKRLGTTTNRSGTVLAGQWELRERIGVGGMGEVYAATCLADRLPYAVKVLSPEHAADPVMVNRFQHEYMVLRRAQHPNIVAAHAFFEVDGEFFYSMDLLEGESLHAMTQERPLPIDRALRLSLQLCDAVTALHALGVVHRDLKPSNVFVTQVDGREHLTLLDLGICKLTPLWYANLEMRTQPGRRIQTREGVVVGTDGYIGGTDERGDLESEVLLDVFGLGATLFRVIVGRLPYKRTPPEASDAPEWLPQDEARIPRDLASVLSAAVAGGGGGKDAGRGELVWGRHAPDTAPGKREKWTFTGAGGSPLEGGFRATIQGRSPVR